jgi:hypothetical protein
MKLVSNAEKFLIELIKIIRVKERINCLLFKIAFNLEYNEYFNKIKSLR